MKSKLQRKFNQINNQIYYLPLIKQKIMDEKKKLEQAIKQIEKVEESAQIASPEDCVMYCGCSKHKSKQLTKLKLDEEMKPSEIIEKKIQSNK